MKHVVIYLLSFVCVTFMYAQEDYNACNSALEICPQQSFTINNVGANKTVCPSCEDDFTFCFTPNNSIWLTFSTNATGGDVQLNFSNLIFQANVGQDNELQATLIQAAIPCNAASYTPIGNCVNNATGNFSLNALALPPNTTYYVVISGDMAGVGVTSAAECTMDVFLNGAGVVRTAPWMNFGYNTSICQNDMFTGLVNITNCPDSSLISWFVNGTLAAVTQDTFFYSSNIQNGDIISVSTSCFSACPVTLTETSLPIGVTTFLLDAGPDVTIADGGSVILQGATTATTYVWTPAFSLSNDTILNPVALPETTTTYTLTATQAGCTLQDYVTITVESDLFFPNTFSPNNDGENDTWVVLGMEKYPDAQLNIYTRWGQLVFQSTGYQKEKAWNGEGKIGPLNEGVYFYEMNLRDKDKRIMKGSITLIR